MPLERRTSDAKFRVYVGEEDSDVDEPLYASVSAKFSLKEFDPVTFSVLKVDPETLAGQLTLIDLPLFKAIQPDELTSCSWNKKDKLVTAPNVVALTRRWNHVCLWCQTEILSSTKPRLRAETLAHFIKIGKRLVVLNNLHSARAIVSGLQSVAIHRLDKTWGLLSTKDKTTLDKMAKIFAETNNYERLRKLLEHVKLPCIPYLGLYLTDLIYIDVAHPSSGGIDSPQRSLQMNNILRVLADFQQSNYDTLMSIECVQNYLRSVHYIDELQKFVEEELYQKSLELEPGENDFELKRRDSLPVTNFGTKNNLPLSIACSVRIKPGSRSNTLTIRESLPFNPSHRKCHSLGSGAAMAKYTNDSFAWGSTEGGLCVHRYLLDDSLVPSSTCDSSCPSSHPSDLADDSGHETAEERGDPNINELIKAADKGYQLDGYQMQGALRRKTVLKDAKRPTVSSWTRYWVMLYGTSLCYFPLRTLPSIPRNLNARTSYKSKPCKVQCVSGWMVVLNSDPHQPGGFQLQQPSMGHVYRLRAESQSAALEWYKHLFDAAEKYKTKIPTNLMQFDEVATPSA